jgi:hypothetical protein
MPFEIAVSNVANRAAVFSADDGTVSRFVLVRQTRQRFMHSKIAVVPRWQFEHALACLRVDNCTSQRSGD